MNPRQNRTKTGLPVVVAAIAIQLTLGIAYLWSLFQDGVAETIFIGNDGIGDHAAAGLTFSVLLATLTLGSVIGGKLAVRYNTRIVVFIGGIILSAGFFLASFVTADAPWLLWLTYGLMGGVGMGFTYSTTIACAQKWYPHKKGLVTGVIVAALGFGGVIFTPLIEVLITYFGGKGYGEQNTFIVLSVVFLIVCTVGCFFMKNPPDGYMADVVAAKAAAAGKVVRDYAPLEMLKTPQFYLIILTFMLAVMGGLMLINFARPIAVDKAIADNIAYFGVLAVSMFNSVGRMVWGMVSDKIGRKNTILILLTGSAILSLFVTAVPGAWFFLLLAIIGFFYGGFLSNFPSLIADIFGAKHMAINYGVVLLGFGIGAIASSQIAGHFRNLAVQNRLPDTNLPDTGQMFPAFVIGSACAAAGIIMMLALKKLQKSKYSTNRIGKTG